MTIANPYYTRPGYLHRPRYGKTSINTKISAAQTYSAKVRKAKITLPKPQWEKEEQREDRS